ncbi:MAG: hypothetical protein RJA09_1752 [Pseudomonadota bacterium]|jgi:hypothetical protein
MKWSKPLYALGACAFLFLSYNAFGWSGVAFAVSGIVMWILMQFNRVMFVMKRAANRPVGLVDSGLMLHVKLEQGQTLLHVVGLTRSLGELLSPENTQPEVYRWTDPGGITVTCTFENGKLGTWEMVRPPEINPAPGSEPPPPDADRPQTLV